MARPSLLSTYGRAPLSSICSPLYPSLCRYGALPRGKSRLAEQKYETLATSPPICFLWRAGHSFVGGCSSRGASCEGADCGNAIPQCLAPSQNAIRLLHCQGLSSMLSVHLLRSPQGPLTTRHSKSSACMLRILCHAPKKFKSMQ